MKKKIVILGSTGSIGKNTIDIIRKNKKNFNVVLLSTNSNIKQIIKQAKEFEVKNIIISNYDKYNETKLKYNKSNINFYNNFKDINKIIKKRNRLLNDLC